MACKQHSGNEIAEIATLPFSQAGEGRHRCAVCAFELGERQGASVYLSRLETLREQIKRLGGTPDA